MFFFADGGFREPLRATDRQGWASRDYRVTVRTSRVVLRCDVCHLSSSVLVLWGLSVEVVMMMVAAVVVDDTVKLVGY